MSTPEQARHSVSATVRPCWSCKGPVGGCDLFCQTCEAVQPPGQLDHYSRLGLDVTFDINENELDRGYFDLQRLLHPDRFATKGPQEKVLSQQQATCLNDAYETLKDPLTRADYLVHLKGVGVLTEGCDLVNDTALLMESMEMREALAEAETPEAINEIIKRARKGIKECTDELSQVFAQDRIEDACHLTTRLKYLRKLLDETRVQKAKLTGAT